jgi:uncharacterized repeat protein (TIGR01451 family)
MLISSGRANVWRIMSRRYCLPVMFNSAKSLARCTVFLLALGTLPALAVPLSPLARERLSAGQAVNVIVEFESTSVDQPLTTERNRRRLTRDDAGLRTRRAQGYAQLKRNVEGAVTASDAARTRDFASLPVSVWRLTSLDALNRLQRQSSVRAVHEDAVLRPVSVSDLSFINQPAAAAQGATGAGTVIAVIDGGLGSNYLSYADFGACTAVNTPSTTCRVLYNIDYYPGASSVVAHGTNVAAIALGVASGAKLAMYDVFNGSGAATSDIIAAMNDIVMRYNASTFNVAAVNLSLGDSSSHATQCGSSNVFNPAYSAFNAPVQSLTNVGVVTVVAAGNSGSKSGLADPACVPGVISVGAVYDGSYGSVSWGYPASCTDSTGADKVTCFSQSASYLSLLAPGSFVSAPDNLFQQSGTSQAAPHVSGAVAALRARYPAEIATQTLKRMRDTGTIDTDTNASNRTTPRLNLYAATNEATLLMLSGTGPAQAVSGSSGVYSLTVTNSGPLSATNVKVTNTLPSGASFVSASSGCSYASGVVTCTTSTLAAGSLVTYTISVQWAVTDQVYDVAKLTADQLNSASASQQQVAIGVAPVDQVADAPLPWWTNVLLAGGLTMAIGRRQRRDSGMPAI